MAGELSLEDELREGPVSVVGRLLGQHVCPWRWLSYVQPEGDPEAKPDRAGGITSTTPL